MARPTARLGALIVTAALLVASCGDDGDERGGGLGQLLDPPTTADPDDDGPDADGPEETGAIEWSDTGGGWEEGTLEVPLDHDDPDGDTIELALVRHRAADGADRLGPLLLNPGGPGASGIEIAMLAELLFPAEVLDRFDIVGFDPRGVEASAPVTCGDDAFLDEYTAFDPVPDSPEETEAALTLIEAFADNCAVESGELLPHVTTVATARDMDLVREALGEEQITYVGFSYGTYLGATYLELFPERVRAAVLDGAYSRSLSPVEMAEGQAVGFERSIDAFLEWCQPTNCDLAAGGDPGGDLLAILDSIDARPMRTNDEDGRQLTVGLAWTGVIMAMYSPGLWPTLDGALVDVRDHGDGSGLLALADQYNDRGPDGTYSNSTFAFVAISCIDDGPLDPAEEAEAAARLPEVAPRVGPLFVSLPGPCEFWPVDPPSDAPTGPFSSPDAPPVVVVATTGDPATPYAWGVQLADELETAVLISAEGDSHTSYAAGNSCVDDAVDAYLLELVVPDDGLSC